MTKSYENQVYKMYEKEVLKSEKLAQKYEKVKFELDVLKIEQKRLKKELEHIDTYIERTMDKIITQLEPKLKEANIEMDQIKKQLQEELVKN